MADLDAEFSALADPTRRAIVALLRHRAPLTTNQIAIRFPVSRWAVMKHLGVLQRAGLVQTLPQGRRRLHFLDARRLEGPRAWLDEVA